MILGILFYVFSSIIYFTVLSRADLSWVYSMGGFSYVFVAVLSSLIENIPLLRELGILFIISGVFIIGAT